jgi:hypothetical protein
MLHCQIIGEDIQKKVGCTAVSMTPLCLSQWCQWIRCACHSGVNDTAVHITAVSMTPLCMSQQCQWLCCSVCSQVRFPCKNSVSNYWRRYSKQSWLHSGVNDMAVPVTVVSMTPLCMSQRCQWQCCACHSGVTCTVVVNDTAVQPTLLIIFANSKPYSKRL